MKMTTWLLVLLSAAVLSGATPAQEKEVMGAIDAWIQATAKQDVGALQKILHDDLSYTHSSALTQTKADVIKDVQDGKGPIGMDLADTKVYVYDNAALVRSMVTMRNRPRNQGQAPAGAPSGNTNATGGARRGPSGLYIMHVLVKGPQGWQLVSRQATRPAPPPSPPAPAQ